MLSNFRLVGTNDVGVPLSGFLYLLFLVFAKCSVPSQNFFRSVEDSFGNSPCPRSSCLVPFGPLSDRNMGDPELLCKLTVAVLSRLPLCPELVPFRFA
jgi:hypothetical protein